MENNSIENLLHLGFLKTFHKREGNKDKIVCLFAVDLLPESHMCT